MTNLTFRDYLKVLFRQKAVIITSILTVIITVAVGLEFKTPVYESQVKILISAQKQVESPYYRELMGPQNTISLTQSEIVKSNPVIERAVNVLGLHKRPLDYEKQFAGQIKQFFIAQRIEKMEKEISSLDPEQRSALLFRIAVEDLKKNIKIEPLRDTNIIVLTASDFSQVGAAIIANIVSRSYIIFDLEQQQVELRMRYGEENLMVRQLKDNIDKTTKDISGGLLPNIDAIGPASVKIIEQALPSFQPSGIPKKLTLLLAVVMSIFLGIMLAFIFEYMDQTFRSPQEAEEFLDIPFLGSIPKKAKIDLYHTLSDQLYLVMKDKNLKSVLITSTLPEEGVSTIIADLGRYLSDKGGHKILIIDANFRTPSIHKIFNLPEDKGFSNLLEGTLSLDKAVKDINTKLAVLPAGKTELNPITLFGSHFMPEIIKQVKEKYDLILIDSPNLKTYKDSISLSSYSDGVVIVINEGKTRRQVVKFSLSVFEQKKINLIGFILNNRKYSLPKVIYDRV
ncbi:polysaccharide biosynthesis tyrosine autokinase [Candidatus Desantisbacteria bacterium]|nr:polysaccharide biosynthesis tyrosine autokinase [Candidatus Desantisbacteria bacterium]